MEKELLIQVLLAVGSAFFGYVVNNVLVAKDIKRISHDISQLVTRQQINEERLNNAIANLSEFKGNINLAFERIRELEKNLAITQAEYQPSRNRS